MEESSPSQNLNGLQATQGGGINDPNKQNDEPNQRIQYSIPGVLHFIQHEWARFEMERSQWEVDRAELQASYALLTSSLFHFHPCPTLLSTFYVRHFHR
jgi:striatin 1/3/4